MSWQAVPKNAKNVCRQDPDEAGEIAPGNRISRGKVWKSRNRSGSNEAFAAELGSNHHSLAWTTWQNYQKRRWITIDVQNQFFPNIAGWNKAQGTASSFHGKTYIHLCHWSRDVSEQKQRCWQYYWTTLDMKVIFKQLHLKRSAASAWALNHGMELLPRTHSNRNPLATGIQ